MNERRAAILFLLPALTVILLFFLLPVCASLLLSLTGLHPGRPNRFLSRTSPSA